MLNKSINHLLHRGIMIPVYPLVSNSNHKLDAEQQNLLTRFYIACGIAVSVLSTQFEISKKGIDLPELAPQLVLEQVQETSFDRLFLKERVLPD